MITKTKILQYTIGPVGAGLLAIITLPLTTWFYSVEDVGRISMLQVFVSFSVLVFSLGLDQAYIREYHDSSDKEALLKTLLIPGLVVCFLIFSLIFAYNSRVLSSLLYNIDSTYLSVITIICLTISLITKFLSLVLRMQERAFAFSISQLLPRILLLILISLSVALDLARDSNNLLTIHTISIVATCLVFGFNTRKTWIKSIYSKFSLSDLRPHLVFGLPLLLGGIASWGLNTSDRLFLKTFSSYAELGVYSVAMSLAGIATIFAGIFNVIWAPLVYRWISEKSIDYKRIDQISEYLLVSIYFITIFFGLFSWVIPLLLPEQYIAVQVLITACLLGPLFNTLAETTAIGITIAKKTKYLMYASIIAVVVGVSCNYFLIPIFGASGAAASLAISFWIYYIIRTEFSRLVWRKIPRKKSYTITFILLIISIANLFIPIDSYLRQVLWITFFLIGIIAFKDTLINIKIAIKGNDYMRDKKI